MAAMQPGTYRARIINYTISENKSGNPQVEILFEYTDGEGLAGTPHQVRWWGQLTEKSLPFVLKVLWVLGFQGKTTAELAKLSDGVESDCLDLGKEVDLVLVEAERNGKKYIEVKYINDPEFAPGGFKNAMTKDKVKVKLGALNIEGQMALIRQEMGAQAPKSASKASNQPPVREPGDDFDVGF